MPWPTDSRSSGGRSAASAGYRSLLEMPSGKRGTTFEQVTAIALAFPGVEARSSYGTPGLYVAKKFMARLREPDVMVLKPVEDDEQRFLMGTQPDVFFLTDHYRGYPAILIRLSQVQPEQMRELIEQSWRRLAPKKLVAEYEEATAGGSNPRAKTAKVAKS
jgi:hypothetical protein